MMTNTTEIPRALLPRRRVTRPARTAVSPSTPTPASSCERRPASVTSWSRTLAKAAGTLPRHHAAATGFLLALGGLAMCLFGGGGMAHAQTSQVLVSNLGQTFQTASGYWIGGAQGFSTGTNADGYTLTSVELRLAAGQVPTVTLHRGSPAGTKVADFTGPSSAAGRADFVDYTFTPTTTVTLDRNTDYWVVATDSAFGDLWAVAGPGEEATSAPGWSIRDRGQSYNPDPGSWQDHGADLANQISVKGTIRQPPPPPPTGGGGGGGAPSATVPDTPINLLADGGNEQVTLSWDAPENDGGSPITDYQYRIDGKGDWISIGSTGTTHTITGLTNGTAYVFQVRAVNAAGNSAPSNRAEATPGVGALDFAHFANGEGITSSLVLMNVATHPIWLGLYFYDQEGQPIDPESVVDLTEDLEVTEDGSLSVRTEMEPLGELTISTHGRGEVASGSVKVAADGPIGGVLRFGLPGIGVAGVGASLPLTDAIFPVRRAGGISTAAAIRNLSESELVATCQLIQDGGVLEEVEIHLAASGQEAQYIEEMFTGTDTSDFVGSVRCTADSLFTGVAVELSADNRIFTTLPVVPVDPSGGEGREAVLDFAHFANGAGITSELVFVNRSTQPSRPAPTHFHSDILPNLPVLYFYDQGGDLIDPESVVDVTGDLVVTEDGSLTVQTEIEPLGVLTISTHGRGDLLSGSVKVTSERPIGGVLRFNLPDIGVAGVGASPPLRDAIFPARRQAGGISTAVAIHNLGEEAIVVSCGLMQDGAVLEETEILLEANGQEALYIEEMFTLTDTSDFVGSVRCTAPPGEGMFTGVAVEFDEDSRILTTLPVVPVPERMSHE